MSDFRVQRGDSLLLDVIVHDGTRVEAPVSVVGWSFWLTVKSAIGDADPGLVQRTIGSGITVVDAPGGSIQVEVPAATIATWAAPGRYYWDLQAKDALARVFTLDRGYIDLVQDVTRAT